MSEEEAAVSPKSENEHDEVEMDKNSDIKPTTKKRSAAKPKTKKQTTVGNTKKKNNSKNSPSTHPHYKDMIKDALSSLKERGGSSRQAILKFIISNYQINVDERTANNHLKMSLRAGVKNESLIRCKGQGASGSFKLGEGRSKKKSKTDSKKVKTPAKTEKKLKIKSPKKSKKVKLSKTKRTKSAKKPKSSKKKAVKKETNIEIKSEESADGDV